MRRLALKSDQQGLKLVNPGEGSLTDEPMFVHNGVEMAFAPTFDRLSVAFVLCNIGLHSAIPQQFACCARIETAIHVEERILVVQPTALHVSKDVFELLLKLIAIIMVTSNNISRRNNIPIGISHWQDIARLCLLSPLICYCFAPFFAALWLPSRLSSDRFNSPLIVMILASKSRCRLPSRLHFRK